MGALRSNAYISYLLIASTLALLGIYLYGSVIGWAWNQLVAVMVVFTIGPGAGGEMLTVGGRLLLVWLRCK